MITRRKFRKAYTRDFSIIMEEAWYHGLANGLWLKLGLEGQRQWPNFFRFNQGVIEVWEDKDFVKNITEAIWSKRGDLDFFIKLLEDYKRLTSELRNEELSDLIYIEKLFEAISIFPIIWYGILDSRTDENLRSQFVRVRDRDTVFDSNDKIVRHRILKKYPDLQGVATTLLREEFLHNPPSKSVLKQRLNNFILVPGEYADVVDLKKFAADFHIKLESNRIPRDHILKGTSANPGKVIGTARIIRMKDEVKHIKREKYWYRP